MSTKCPNKVEKNCPKNVQRGRKHNFRTFFWIFFAYLLGAFVWWPCPMLARYNPRLCVWCSLYVTAPEINCPKLSCCNVIIWGQMVFREFFWMQLFFAYSWKLPAYNGASSLTIDNFSFSTYNWSSLLAILAFSLTILACLLTVGAFCLQWESASNKGLKDCRQRSLSVSKTRSNCK